MEVGMELMMNGLLLAATLFAGGYCWVLSRRVSDLKSLDKGLGASIVNMTRQIELARTTLEESRAAAKMNRVALNDLIAKSADAERDLRDVVDSASRLERNLRLQIVQAADRQRVAARSAVAARADEAPAAPAPLAPAAPAEAAPTAPLQASHDVEPAGAMRQGVPAALERAEATDAPGGEQVSGESPRSEDAVPDSSESGQGAELLRITPLKPRAARITELPKPNALPPIGNPLRNRAALRSVASEDELLEALSALAGTGKR
jgi:hypothetical protein